MLQLGQLSERKVWLAWCCSFKCCTFSNKKCQMNLPSSEKKRFCLPDGRFGKRTNFSVPKCDPFFGLLAWCCSFQCCALPAQIRSIQEKRAKSSFFRFACLVLQLVGVAATVGKRVAAQPLKTSKKQFWLIDQGPGSSFRARWSNLVLRLTFVVCSTLFLGCRPFV